MKDKFIVITGSNGRIGSALAKRLSMKGKIIAVDHRPPLYTNPNQSFVQIDFSDETSIVRGFGEIRQRFGSQLAGVIHLVAYYSFSSPHSELYQKITINGTRNLLKALQAFQVEQFIFSSTMLVHAPCQLGEKIKEDSPIHPRWAYPKSKVKTEKVIAQFKNKIPSLVLRIAGVYDDICHSIPLANQIQRIYERRIESYLFPGNLNHGSSYIHMEDLIDLIEYSLEARPIDDTILVGESKTLSYDFLQKNISRLLFSRPIQTYHIPKSLAKAVSSVQNFIPFIKKSFIQPWMIDIADDHYDLDIAKAKKLLNWIPRRSLEQTLPKMIESLQADPLKWYQSHKLV